MARLSGIPVPSKSSADSRSPIAFPSLPDIGEQPSQTKQPASTLPSIRSLRNKFQGSIKVKGGRAFGPKVIIILSFEPLVWCSL
jgi:hypothetical protein